MRTETFTSAAGHRYDVHLHVPDDIDARAVVWLLDAPTTWPPMHEALAAGTGTAAVVAVDWHGDGAVDRRLRFRDFTFPPRRPDDDPDADEAGGAAAFRDVLIDRLRTALRDRLPSTATHCLVGHSLSGLFVLETLLSGRRAFDRYAALSPSLWWDDASLLARAHRVGDAGGKAPRVLLRAGLGEQAAGPEKPAEIAGDAAAALLGARHMVANAQAFARALDAQGVACDHDVLPGVDHHGMLRAAMPDVLAFACAD